MDETKLRRDLERAHQAKTTLEQVDFRIEAMASNLHAKWEATKSEDFEGREACWRQLKAVRELQRSFKQDIDAGRLAEVELEKMNG
jgi:hypothetical protein